MTVRQSLLLLAVAIVALIAQPDPVLSETLRDMIQNKISEITSSEGASNMQEQNGDNVLIEEDEPSEFLELDVEESDAQDIAGGSVMQISSREFSAEELNAQEETLLQHASSTDMSFDCYARRTEDSCEVMTPGATQMCVWKDEKCIVSAAAVAMLCEFYCEHPICLQKLPSAPQQTKCVPKPSAILGLCAAVNTMAGCQSQQDLCSWTKKGKCIDAPSCCSKAQRYCAKKTRQNLNRAMHSCGDFTTSDGLCDFNSDRCSIPSPAST